MFSPLPDELTPAADISTLLSAVSELCLNPPMNVVRVHVFLKEKLNDHSLPGLHLFIKTSKHREVNTFQDHCSSS
jgi:hypothetical protein